MTVTNRNRYVGQLSPRQKHAKAVRTPNKKWTKVRTIADLEMPHPHLIPIYKK